MSAWRTNTFKCYTQEPKSNQNRLACRPILPLGKAKTTASRQVAFVVQKFWFTEPECRSVRGHLGRTQTQEDLNVTPTYSHTHVTSVRRMVLGSNPRTCHRTCFLNRQRWQTRYGCTANIITEMHNGNHTCHSRTQHLPAAYLIWDPYIITPLI